MELVSVPAATKRNQKKQVVAKVGIEDEDNIDSRSNFEEESEGQVDETQNLEDATSGGSGTNLEPESNGDSTNNDDDENMQHEVTNITLQQWASCW